MQVPINVTIDAKVKEDFVRMFPRMNKGKMLEAAMRKWITLKNTEVDGSINV